MFHNSLNDYRHGFPLGGVETGTADEDMFTFSMMRDPLSWFESVFVHSLAQTENDPDHCLTEGGANDWRLCLEPITSLVKERARLGESIQSSSAFDAAKVKAFRKWIELLTTTIPTNRVLQTQNFLNMAPGDTRRPVDCLVHMRDISWAWAFLRSTYHIVDAPEKPPLTNHVSHVAHSNAAAAGTPLQMYDCATARRVYHYARMDFDVLKMSCEESMPPALAACACADS